jgi:hypothetical protein
MTTVPNSAMLRPIPHASNKNYYNIGFSKSDAARLSAKWSLMGGHGLLNGRLRMDAQLKKVVVAMVLLVGTGLLFGCGGGSSGGDSPASTNNPTTTPAQVDLNGTWQVEEVVSGNCSDTNYPTTEIHIFTGTQQGDSLTLHDVTDGTDYTGTVSGYTLTIHGTVPDGIGTLTTNATCSCTSDGQGFSGSGQWTYQETGYTCNGTAQVTGTKLDTAQVDATGTWSGTFSSTNHSGISGTFSAAITDTNGQLTGTISVPFIGMTDAELVGTVSGTAITFGDIDNRITFTGTATSAGNAQGTYNYDAMGDTGTWNADRQ